MKFRLSLIIPFVVFIQNGISQENLIERFNKKEIIADGDTLKYGFYKPENLITNKKYPLVLALHGMEHACTKAFCMSFDEFMSTYPFQLATAWAAPKVQNKYPCYIVAPHITDLEINKCGLWTCDNIIALIDTLMSDLSKIEPIDTNRIYLTGHSMGGRGTFMLPVYIKDKFAAIAPMAAAIDGDHDFVIKKMDEGVYKNLPIWCFHHRDDGDPSSALREIFQKADSMDYEPLYTGTFGSKPYKLSDNEINEYMDKHQSYLYTEYSYKGAIPHWVMDTASVDTLFHKWLFKQYKIDNNAIKIEKVDIANDYELSWSSKNQSDEVEIWFKSDNGWKLLEKKVFAANKFNLTSELTISEIQNGKIRVVTLNKQGFIYGRDEQNLLHVTNLVENIKSDEIRLYPNPAKSRVFINCNSNKLINYQLYNIQGKLLEQGKLNRRFINVSKLVKGVYLVLINIQNESPICRKVIIE